MFRFPKDLSDLLTQRARALLIDDKYAPLINFAKQSNNYHLIEEALSSEACKGIIDVFDATFYDQMGTVNKSIDPHWLTKQDVNYDDWFGKTMHARTHVLWDKDDPLYVTAKNIGLIDMLDSESTRRYVEHATGLKLEAGYGTQISCIEPGHYVGPHNDHHPTLDWAKNGYVDFHIMVSNEHVDHQYFIAEKNGHLENVWDINHTQGALSFLRLPFWHHTTPLVAKKGSEHLARRWHIANVYRIVGVMDMSSSEGSTAFKRFIANPFGQEDTLNQASVEVNKLHTSPIKNNAEQLSMPVGSLTERHVRLSDSQIWDWQAEFYQEQGTLAWENKTVPDQITNSPYLAKLYFRAIQKYYRLNQHKLTASNPMKVVELGAGSGKLAFHILNEIKQYEYQSKDVLHIQYVMTDLSLNNIREWAQHPQLKQFIETGLLKVEQLNVCAANELAQSISNLVTGSTHILIANYLIDSIPFDVFEMKNGQLCIQRFQVDATRDKINKTVQTIDLTEASIEPYNSATELLTNYVQQLPEGTRFSYSSTFISAISLFIEASQNNLLLLVTDKSICQVDSLANASPTSLALHGSFSSQVNLGPLNTLFEINGGEYVHSEQNENPVCISAFFCNQSNHDALVALKHHFELEFTYNNPMDFHLTLSQALKSPDNDLSSLCALLRISCYDPWLLQQIHVQVRHYLASSDQAPQFFEGFKATLHRLFRNHYDLSKDGKFAFDVAVLFHVMQDLDSALSYYKKACAQTKEAKILFNTAICLIHKGLNKEAVAYLENALRLDPRYTKAKDKLSAVQKTMTTEGA